MHLKHRWLNSILVLTSLVLLTTAMACASVAQPTDDQPASDEQLTAEPPQASEQQTSEQDAAGEEPMTALEARQKRDALMADTVAVIKADTDIPAGTPLTEDKVTTEDIPTRFLPANPVLEREFDIYVGTPVSTQIEAGAMILTSDFQVAQVPKSLSSRIPQGERALPLEFANLRYPCDVLKPGDRVDVIGTFAVDKNGDVVAAGGEVADRMTVTLVQNATTLSIGPRMSGVAEYDEDSGCAEFEAVSLAVTPKEAELLSAVQSAGELHLMLRHQDDLATGAAERSSLSEMIDGVEKLAEERKARIKRRPRPPSGDKRIEIIRSSD